MAVEGMGDGLTARVGGMTRGVMVVLIIALLAPRWYGMLLQNMGLRYLAQGILATEPERPELFWRDGNPFACPVPRTCEAAYTWLSRAHRSLTDRDGGGYFLGLAAALSGQGEVAAKVWASVRGNGLFRSMSYFWLGHQLAQQSRLDEAYTWWGRGQVGPLLLRQALARARQGQVSEALFLLESALRVDPNLKAVAREDVAKVYRLVGDARVRAKEWRDAEAAYRQALIWAPQRDEYRILLARVLRRQRRYNEAEALLREVTSSLDPRWQAEAWYSLGELARAQAQWSQAIAAYERAVRLRPDSARYLRALAELYRRQGMKEKADEILQRLQNQQ